MIPDSPALRAVLERQVAVLAPVVIRLRAATARPPISPYDWRGPAATAARDLEQRLRSALVSAEDAGSEALRAARLALAQSGG